MIKEDVRSAGGIALWSESPLLSQSMLPRLLSKIEPTTGNGLQPILQWAHDESMGAPLAALRQLIASKIPTDAPLDEGEKTVLVSKQIQESVRQFGLLRSELADKSLHDYVAQLINDLSKSDGFVQSNAGRDLFKVMSWALFLQDVADNPRYNPHDFRHSLVVAKWMAALIQAEPEMLASYANRYQCTHTQALALFQLAGLFHDCGYPFMASSVEPSSELSQGGSQPSLTKATHAAVGGLMFNALVRPLLSDLLSKQGVTDTQALCSEITRAIHLHSSDSPTPGCGGPIEVSTVGGGVYQVRDEHGLSALSQQLAKMSDPIARAKIQNPCASRLARIKAILPENTLIGAADNPLSAARELDAKWVGDKALATPCIPVGRFLPMDYCMRVADNLDIEHKRLNQVQASGVYGRSMLKFHEASDLQESLNNIRAQIQDFYDNKHDYADSDQWPESPANVLVNVCATSKKDINYLVGLLAVATVTLKPGSNGRVVVVQLQPLPRWLKAQNLSDDAVRRQAYFQIERLKSALNFIIDAPKVEVRWPDRLFQNEPQAFVRSEHAQDAAA